MTAVSLALRTASSLLFAGLVSAQALRVDGARAGFRVHGPQPIAEAGDCVRIESLQAGAMVVCFRPDGTGRPAPLPLEVSSDCSVRIAVFPPPPGTAASTAGFGAAMAGWSDGPDVHWRFASGTLAKVPDQADDGAISARLAPDTGADQLVRVRVRPTRRDAGLFGVVARLGDADQHYRLAWDVVTAQIRLERQLGSHVEVLGRHDAPELAGDGWHELALQVEGFRLQAWLDDLPIAQVLDGAHGQGRIGVFATTAAGCEFTGFTAGPPLPPTSSAAVLVAGGSATLVARAPGHAGGVYAMTLSLDRPHPLLPQSAGMELFVLQRAAAPLVLCGSGRLGEGAFGDIGPLGEISARLRWPRLPILRGQSITLAAVLGTPDAELAVGRLPGIALTL